MKTAKQYLEENLPFGILSKSATEEAIITAQEDAIDECARRVGQLLPIYKKQATEEAKSMKKKLRNDNRKKSETTPV